MDTGAQAMLGASAQLGWKLGLERVTRLCALLGDPQDALRTVHVAGTNGKGSTAAMIAAALTAAGYVTGLYLSPYVEGLGECLSVNGEGIARGEYESMACAVAEQVKRMAGEGDPPTLFEVETALAFTWFRHRRCDAAVIETGLGGRLDATNVIRRPLVSVITSISLDHTDILGGTLSAIAREKCGILKPGGACISAPGQQPEAMAVIRESAAAAGIPLTVPDLDALRITRSGLDGTSFRYGSLELRTKLIGRRQPQNASAAVEALRALGGFGLPVPDACIREGIACVSLPMRQEVIDGDPVFLLDGAHNLDKLTALADTMREHLRGRRTAVIMGMLKDKQYEPSIRLIAQLADTFVACAPASPRALPSADAARIAALSCRAVLIDDDVRSALDQAARAAGLGGAVVVCGSFYLAGWARKEIMSSK